MTGRAIVVLRLVRVKRTGRVTFVLVHDQMMVAAGAFVRPVLAAAAIGLAGHARAVLRIFVITVGTLLKANGQIGHTEVSGGAGKARILTGSGADLARLVTGPTDATLIRKTSRRTTTDARVVESIIFASDALRRAFPVTALRVALRVAIVEDLSGGVQRTVRYLRGWNRGRIEGRSSRGIAR